MAKRRARKKTSPGQKSRNVSPVGDWQQSWKSLGDRNQHLISVLALILISVGFYAPIHFSNAHLIAGDTVQWRSMANDMVAFHAKTGQSALWSMNSFGGMPGFMISYPLVVPQIDVIPGMLRAVVWPSSHLILLLVGMYLLVWTITKNKLAAVFSSVSFGLTTYIPVLLLAGHNTKFVALAWAPWLLLAFVHVLEKPGLLSGLLFSIAASVNLRAGHVQITYYVVVICVVWWIGAAIQSFRAGQIKSFALSSVWLLLASTTAVLMLAQPYWAFAEYKPFSIRGAASGGAIGGLSWQYAMGWSQGVSENLTLLIANAFGGGGALYWGPKSFTGGPHYFGGLTIAFALYTVLKKPTLTVVVLWISSILMFLFALGENFPLLNRLAFAYLPFFSSIRVPETWLIAVALNMSVLAGMGIADVVTSLIRNPSRSHAVLGVERSLAGTFGVLIAIVLVLLLASDAFMSFSRADEPSRIFTQLKSQVPDIKPDDPRVSQVISQELSRRRDERRSVFNSDARRTLFFLVTGLILIYLMQRRKVQPWLATAGLVVLVAFDLGGVGRRFINKDNLSAADTPEAAVKRYAFDDYLLERVREAGGSGHFRVLSLEMGKDPSTNARPSFFYESLGGYSGAKLRVYQDFLDQILFTRERSRLNPNALAIMNVRYLVGRRPARGYELVFQDDASGQSVFKNATIPDRAHFVGSVETITGAEATWDRLADDDFEPRTSAILSELTDHVSSVLDSASVATTELISHSNQEFEWNVETDAARWLVISETYYPRGWTAYIDDQTTPIFRANYLNRAVFVPEGSHRVRMRFDPQSHSIGVWVSGVSTALVYGVLLVRLALLVPGFKSERIEGQDDSEHGPDGSPEEERASIAARG